MSTFVSGAKTCKRRRAAIAAAATRPLDALLLTFPARTCIHTQTHSLSQIVDTVNKEDPKLDRSSHRRRRRRRNTCKIPKWGVEINGGFPGR